MVSEEREQFWQGALHDTNNDSYRSLQELNLGGPGDSPSPSTADSMNLRFDIQNS